MLDAVVPPRTLHDLTFSALQAELAKAGLRPAHTMTLWGALHREAATNLSARKDFLPPLQRWVASAPHALEIPTVDSETASSDGLTRKFLLRLDDGQTVETVIMGYAKRFTACISTQAGCAMGCVFCATGQMGFVRHLRPGEIVAQVLQAQRSLRAHGFAGLRNLVFMGMGEPLHNYEAVMTALDIITHTGGINIGPSRISVSTVGVVPGIVRMADENRPYNLAVSLHGATEEQRAALVPISRRWPLSELMEACRYYACKTGCRIFFGWTLIAGQNDSQEQAHQVAGLLRGIDAHINLIPLNPTQGFLGSASADSAGRAFQKILIQAGFPCTFRQRRGIDVDAGCGQLRAARTAKPKPPSIHTVAL